MPNDNFRVCENQNLFDLPSELKKKVSLDEFNKMMSSSNSDIPISEVRFRSCKNDVNEAF